MKKVLVILLALAFAAILLPACGGGGGDGGGETHTITLNGGNGLTQNGGAGGYVEMESYGIQGIQILRGNRSIKTSFKLPVEADQDLGVDPVIISTDTTVDVYVDQAAADADATLLNGEPYLLLGNGTLWVQDSVGGEYAATGLVVERDATLTLGLNVTNGGGTGQDTTYLWFDNCLVIEGTITTKTLDSGTVNGLVIETRHSAPATARDKGYLNLQTYLSIWVTQTGLIDLAGTDGAAAGDRGGDGAAFYLFTQYGGIYIHGNIEASGGDGNGAGVGGNAGTYCSGTTTSYLDSNNGVVVTTGAKTIDLSGGDGATGGNAGDFYVEAEYNWWNNGTTIMANGGDGSAGDGGSGGYMYFESYYGSIYFKGLVQSNGGDAVTGDAGDAKDIDFYPAYDDYMGEMSVAGRIEMIGGDAQTGNGGDGGEVEYYFYGSGELRSTAEIIADGGSSTGAGNYGGSGGGLYIYKYVGYDEVWSGDYNNPMSVLVTGNISANGGEGDYGGTGGWVEAYQTDDGVDMNAPDYGIFFYAYRSIDANGGDGAVNGGGGGYFEAYTYDSWTDGFMYAYWQNGPIIDQTDFSAHGGNGGTGTGGNGDEYYLYTDYEATDGNCVFHHRGDIDLSGGDGGAGGGTAGYVYAYAIDKARIDGNIDLSGGDGTGANASGGNGNYIEMYSTYKVIMNGNIDASGGLATGTGTGGSGGNTLYLEAGGQTTVTGNIDARGGDSSASGVGGDGGYIEITSEWTGSIFNGKALLDGGEAGTAGTAGELYVDGVFMYGDY